MIPAVCGFVLAEMFYDQFTGSIFAFQKKNLDRKVIFIENTTGLDHRSDAFKGRLSISNE